MKNSYYYVALVKNKHSGVTMPVAIAPTVQEAGKLATQWIQDYDNGGLDFEIYSIFRVASDYCQV